MIELDNGRSLKEELMISRYMDGYDPKANYNPPPTLAPEQYTATYNNPITAPVSLTSLNSQFGDGSSNLRSLVLALPGVPASPPIAMSDFIGKSGNYRVNGKIRLDRWDDITGAGMSNAAKNTWDGSNGTFMPASEAPGAGGSGWNNCFCSDHAFSQRLSGGAAKSKVTAVRNLSWHFTYRTNIFADWSFYGICVENGNFVELTYKYGGGTDAGDVSGDIKTYNVNFVTNGVLQTPVKNDVVTSQRWARVYNHIESGCLIRTSHQNYGGKISQFTDVYANIDCDVAIK